jgi:hypothetical protein
MTSTCEQARHRQYSVTELSPMLNLVEQIYFSRPHTGQRLFVVDLSAVSTA